MTAIDEIKARIDIVDLVTESVQLRKSGKNYTGFCPFHSNTRTPAFVVFPDTGTWRCFGQCNEGGDIFRFVMKKEGCDFTEALRYLAEKAGVQLKAPTPDEQAAAEEHDNLRELLEDAVTFYRHQLLKTPAGQPVLEYLRQKRLLKDDTIEAFGLGYAPQSWDTALVHFKSKGHSEQDLINAGLVTVRENTQAPQPPGSLDPDQSRIAARRLYDRFRHRILIPIRDERGRMAGFGARIVNPDDVPKFLNSPQTPIFDKGHLLYGLDRARKAIRTTDQAVIVEGYLDVIALHQAGFANTISPMGTALTEHQLYLLKRFTKRIVLALDPDAAGDKATLRGLQLARQAMDHETEMVFDARGLLRHEARLQADIRVTTLPPGMDPDDVVNRDPQEWERILANAKPIVTHVMTTLATGRDLNDPKTKREIANQVLPLVEDVPDSVERETYRQQLARLLQIDERALLDRTSHQFSRLRRGRVAASTAQTQPEAITAPPAAGSRLEAHCMGVLMRRPDLLYRVDRVMKTNGLPTLSSGDFQRAEHQTIFDLLHQSLEQEEVEPLNYILNRLTIPLIDVADGLLRQTEKLDPNEERVLEDLLRTLLALRRQNLRQNIEYLRFSMEDIQLQGSGGQTLDEHQQEIKQYNETLKRIDRAVGELTDRSATR